MDVPSVMYLLKVWTLQFAIVSDTIGLGTFNQNSTDIPFQTESLLSIEKGANIAPFPIQNTLDREKPYSWKRRSNRSLACIVRLVTTTAPSCHSWDQPKLPPVLHVHTSDFKTSLLGLTPSFSSSVASFSLFFCKVRYDRRHFTAKCPLLQEDLSWHLAIIRSKIMHKLTGERTLNIRQRDKWNCFGSFRGRKRGTSTSSDKECQGIQDARKPCSSME